MTDTVTAIVVSYYTGPSLKECLYILLDEPKLDKIIIVNNGRADATLDWMEALSAKFPKISVISGHGNIGFGAGVNLGARHATTPYLLVLNPDALLVSGSVSHLVEAAEDNPKAGIIGGHLFGVDGKPCRGPRRNAPKWLEILRLRKWEFHRNPLPENTEPSEIVSGAFFLVRRHVFDAIRGFDEAFFLHFEDIDLCLRGNAAGYPTLFCPQAAALHYGSTSRTKTAIIRNYKAKSLERYLNKHAKTRADRIANLVFLPPIKLILRWVGALR